MPSQAVCLLGHQQYQLCKRCQERRQLSRSPPLQTELTHRNQCTLGHFTDIQALPSLCRHTLVPVCCTSDKTIKSAVVVPELAPTHALMHTGTHTHTHTHTCVHVQALKRTHRTRFARNAIDYTPAVLNCKWLLPAEGDDRTQHSP